MLDSASFLPAGLIDLVALLWGFFAPLFAYFWGTNSKK